MDVKTFTHIARMPSHPDLLRRVRTHQAWHTPRGRHVWMDWHSWKRRRWRKLKNSKIQTAKNRKSNNMQCRWKQSLKQSRPHPRSVLYERKKRKKKRQQKKRSDDTARFAPTACARTSGVLNRPLIPRNMLLITPASFARSNSKQGPKSIASGTINANSARRLGTIRILYHLLSTNRNRL